MALQDALKTLSENDSSSFARRMSAVAEICAEISRLETEMNLPHSLPTLSAQRAKSRLLKLQAQRADMPPAPAPAAIVAPPAAGVKSDLEILSATLAEYRQMDAITRAQFCEDGGALAKADFQSLNPAAKMAFMRAGGKILEAVQARQSVPPVQAAENTNKKSRADFEKLSPSERMNFMRSGGQVEG